MILEICAASVADASIAAEAGAGRIELNSALEVGGLTPSLGCVQQVLAEVSIPVIAMARPRPGGFCYSQREFETLLRDTELLLDCGVAGVAFGVLNEHRQIDVKRCNQVVRTIGQRQAVFHRAFDLVDHKRQELERLIECGVTRVMTSGGQATAIAGASCIADLVEAARQRVAILVAGGVRIDHVESLVRRTGARQLHAGLHELLDDLSYPPAGQFSFYAPPPAPGQYRQTSSQRVAEMVQCLSALVED